MSPDSRLVALESDRRIDCFEGRHGRLIRSISNRAFGSHNQGIVTDGTVITWIAKTITMAEPATKQLHSISLSNLTGPDCITSASPSGSVIGLCDNGFFRLSMARSQVKETLCGLGIPVFIAAAARAPFATFGTYVIHGFSSGLRPDANALHMLDLHTNALYAIAVGPGLFRAAAVAPDGGRIALVTGGVVRIARLRREPSPSAGPTRSSSPPRTESLYRLFRSNGMDSPRDAFEFDEQSTYARVSWNGGLSERPR